LVIVPVMFYMINRIKIKIRNRKLRKQDEKNQRKLARENPIEQ